MCKMISRLMFLGLVSLISQNCLSKESNQLGLGQWTGVWLDSGEKVVLEDLPEEVFALNVYSPNCIPCYREIPSLHRVRERLTADPRFGIYMAIDPILVSESVEGDFGTNDPRARGIAIMQKEVRDRKIQIPVIVLDPPFRVSNASFVTGTPETVLIRTRPWNIYYNFLGSISEKEKVAEIDADPKIRFFLNTMGARKL